MDFLGSADVLVQNLRPGSLEELASGPTCCSRGTRGWSTARCGRSGSTGPLKLKPGFEPMVQAFSGLMMMNGDEGGPPTRIGTSILDYGTGMWTAMGALAGLMQRAATGRGCVVDASLYETGLAWLKGHFASFRASGEAPERHRTGGQRVVPFQGFETKTGTISWPRATIGSLPSSPRVVCYPEWTKEERFATNAARVAHKPALLALQQYGTEPVDAGHHHLLEREQRGLVGHARRVGGEALLLRPLGMADHRRPAWRRGHCSPRPR